MIINDKLYDLANRIVQIGLPALATLVASLGAIWDWDNTDKTVKTIVAFNLFLGALVVLARFKYTNSDARFDGVIDPNLANAQTSTAALKLTTDEYDAANQESVTLKVVQHEPPL